MTVITACELRPEVLKGDLDDAIFAANFGDLTAGKAPKVYSDAKTFFRNTHPAQQLSKVVQAVFQRLANKKEGGVTIRLSTGFGGGKTHTLMAMWHLAHHISDPSMGIELLPAAGRPRSVKVAAIDAGKVGTNVFARHGRIKVKSLWAELAFQLKGESQLKAFAAVDDPQKQPDEWLLEKMFPNGPVLILLDELVVYMGTLSEQGKNNLLAFLHKLLAVVSKRPQTALVITDPGGQPVFEKESTKLSIALRDTMRLGELLGRRMSNFDPIGKEAAKVIVRRLFESVDSAAAQAASAVYHSLYQRVTQEAPGSLPTFAISADYAGRIVESYPFHPRLLDTAQDRLGALVDFQKSRGVLRLFARILRDVWASGQKLQLITAGEINWSSPRIQADLLQRLNKDQFKAAVGADVEKHAGELDGSDPWGIHRRVASALLLESLPLQSNSGLDPAELTLAVLRPDEAGPEPAKAMERLVGVCWHTYPMPGGRGWQFRYEPNVIKLIEERSSSTSVEDGRSRVLTEAYDYFRGPFFKLVSWPTSARQVPESADLQLVLCENEKLARAVCAYVDDSDPKAPIPRRFQNAIVAVTANSTAFDKAVDRARRLLAAEAIEHEYRSGDQNKQIREQLRRLKPTYQREFRIQTCRAFDRVILPGGMAYTSSEKYQVPENQMLQRAQGQTALRKFLEDQGFIYQPGEALDVDRFLKEILPGTTPVVGQEGVYTAKAIHERFLSAPGLRLLPDGGVVRQTLLRAVSENKIVVRTPDGRAYDDRGSVTGEPGFRRRDDRTLITLRLEDDIRIALAEQPVATEWLKENISKPGAKPKKIKEPLPPPPSLFRVEASTWEKISEFAPQRPLVELHLIANTPTVATALTGFAQPFGADKIQLSVNVGGTLKSGGSMNFAANDVRLSHPARPLQISQTIFNSLGEGGEFRADLALQFRGEGRRGLEQLFSDLSEKAPEGLSVKAVFEKP